MTRFAFVTAILVSGALIIASNRAAVAQETSLEKSKTILASIEQKRPDYIALIQDVSGSMLTNGMMTKARQAALRVVKEAAVQGTYVRIVGVNASEHLLYDGLISSNTDRKKALDAIPYKALDGAGTNLRLPHHAALRQALERGAKSPVIVFVTDSYNDAPRDNPTELNNYASYYDKGGDLTKIAKTSTGDAYRRDIAAFAANGGRTFGFGVNIDASSHRPVERSPKDITTPVTESKPIAPANIPPPPPDDPIWPYLLGGVVLIGVAGIVFLLNNRKPLAVSIEMGTRSGRDLVFRGGDAVGIGGLAAGCTQTLPFPGNTGAIALLMLERGVLVAKPVSASGQPPRWVLSVNGVDVSGTAAIPVRVGDTLRIRSVAGDTESIAEYRWKVAPVSWERGKT
ncbi:MAG: vWA domain-containing protein [Armatimonadota bacterium]